jgi:hypothetical protein
MLKNRMRLFSRLCLMVSITICGCSSDSSSSDIDPEEDPTVGTTEEKPYEITSAEDLIQLASDVNSCKSYAGVYFKMTTDIVLNEGNAAEWGTTPPTNIWVPIGKKNDITACPFSGTFDGDGHTISGLYFNDTNAYAGLFGVVYSGRVKNMGLINSYINARYAVGSIVGYNFESVVEKVYNEASVSATSQYVGGLVGVNVNGSIIQESYNSGNVNGSFTAGGIAGSNNASEIKNVFNKGNVSASKINVGGIAGENVQGASITNCYLIATIVNGDSTRNAGTIVGTKASSATVVNCYYDNFISTLADTLAEGKSTSEMKVSGFVQTLNNGTDVWKWVSKKNGGYPSFSWME